MTIRPLILGFMSLIFLSSGASVTEAAEYHRYNVPSGIITFSISGSQNGTETLYFENWGMREAKHTTAIATIGDTEVPSSHLTILDGDWLYTVDLNKKSGLKLPNSLGQALLNLPEGLSQTEVSDSLLEQLGATKLGQEEFLGRTCDVWEAPTMHSKIWVWEGIPIRTEVKMGNLAVSVVATDIQESSDIPQDKFEIPADVKVYDQSELQNMIQGLKDSQTSES